MLLIVLQIASGRFQYWNRILKEWYHKKSVYYFKTLLILLIGLLICSVSKAQQSQVKFNILKNDKSIGTIVIEKKEYSPYTDYEVFSRIEVSFIKKFRVNATEKFRYKNDQLIFSSVNRSINENQKAIKELVFKKGSYLITEGDSRRIFEYPKITSNLVLLYFSEPKDINSVYCDNLQMMVDIQKTGENQYRIDFPNGVSNLFHYQDGRCIQVDVHGTFFKARLHKI
ncbi:hypothetical protein NE848_11460 [Gramella jeungdoensis]|uniref:GLPGLI family protein n=1 Tax=Gramella jeungdoensis TaxID=708091 RepID=A0ABT0Z444_9FLAO|nr:DUF6134 family protein [Gramella jeungdoensis]MCM8570000.1 hypothetical protein [Gramella jeungdoensis]